MMMQAVLAPPFQAAGLAGGGKALMKASSTGD
jgi:hypothetical protein